MTIIIGIVLVILIGSAIYQYIVWVKFLNEFQIELEENRPMPELNHVPYETIYIPSENHKIIKAWVLHQPEKNDNTPVVLVGHGWTRNATFLWPISYSIWQAGYRVICINARNHGESDVDPPMSVMKYAEDLNHTYPVIKQLFPKSPIAIVGHSLGGAASIIHTSQFPEITSVVALAPFSDSKKIFLMDLKKAKVPFIPFGWFTLFLVKIHLKLSFEQLAPKNYIKHIHVPILLIRSENDQRIPAFMQDELVEAAPSTNRPETVTIPQATHTSLLTEDITQRVILRFLAKHHPIG